MKLSECVAVLEDRLARSIHDHGELIAMLRIPRNRDMVYAGNRDAIDDLFRIVDALADAHSRLRGLVKGGD